MLEVRLAPVKKAKKQKQEKQSNKKPLATAKHIVCCVRAHVCACISVELEMKRGRSSVDSFKV